MRARLQGMLDFEAALARAEASIGLFPRCAADVHRPAPAEADLFDIAALARDTAQAGNPAIPMVKQLTALVAKHDPAAARFVHWGATSQDAIDTGLVLQIRAGLAGIEPDLQRLTAALAALAETHAKTVMIGRTLLQQAVPVTFGLKAAGWLAAVERTRARLAAAGRAAQVLQFGGAAGTLAALGDRGLDVAAALAKELDLALPELPWHGHRDRLVDVAAALGLLVGTLGKMARDLSLLMQTEVAEAFEPAGQGRGGSSTMPHKRNPIACAVALAAATRVRHLVATLLAAMPQEQERGLGGWHAEWETLPEIFLLASGALHHMADAIAGLTLDTERMRDNIDGHARPRHGRGGDDGAGRTDRQARGPPSRGVGVPTRAGGGSASARRPRPRTRRHGAADARGARSPVRAGVLSRHGRTLRAARAGSAHAAVMIRQPLSSSRPQEAPNG